MPIPTSQLETWSHQGSITQSSNTYNSIKKVLEASSTPYSGKSFKVFLQGSYGNDTNIYAESDVDIVIRLDDYFYSDLENLSKQEKTAYKQASSGVACNYTLMKFKQDVLKVLYKQYNSAVHLGSKAIVIDGGNSRRKADVIVSFQCRRYSCFRSASDCNYVEGIYFLNSSEEGIANYPRQHSDNLTSKHKASSRLLKPMVRILKNMRSRLVKCNEIKVGVAPSYYVEGLLYNVPIAKFISNYEKSVVNVLNWYMNLSDAEKKKLVCANEQHGLLRNGSPVSWDPVDCDTFVNAVKKLWDGW